MMWFFASSTTRTQNAKPVLLILPSFRGSRTSIHVNSLDYPAYSEGVTGLQNQICCLVVQRKSDWYRTYIWLSVEWTEYGSLKKWCQIVWVHWRAAKVSFTKLGLSGNRWSVNPLSWAAGFQHQLNMFEPSSYVVIFQEPISAVNVAAHEFRKL